MIASPGTTQRRSFGGPALLLAALLVLACGDSDSDGDPSPGAGEGGGSAGEASAGTGGRANGGSGTTGGSSAAGTGGASNAGRGGAAADAGADAGGFTEMGVCGQRGEATVNETTFTGFEEFFIISDEGFGDDICVVRFDVMRVGEAPDGCDDPTADVDCLWTHMVEFSNPSVVTDVDGVCANSELGLDADAIAEIEGSRAAYGFVSEFAGHNSVLMKYDEAMAKWDAYGNGTWDEAADMFGFDRRDGLCDY